MSGSRDIVGCVLAGGSGKRIGGDKAIVELDGRPLIRYPLDTLRDVFAEVAVVARRDTALPAFGSDVRVWIEPDGPRHPLAGARHALELAAGRAVFCCAVDLPLLDAATVRAVVDAVVPGSAGAAARRDGRLEPLCACYTPVALAALERFPPGARAADVLAELGLAAVDVADPAVLFNVNAPEDLLAAGAILADRDRAPQPKVNE